MHIPENLRCQLKSRPYALQVKHVRQVTRQHSVTPRGNNRDIYTIFIDTCRFLSYSHHYMAIDGPLKIDREDGKAPGTLVLRLAGPLTLRNIFDLQAQMRNAQATPLTILDLTEVPYMDSAGMGVVVNFHVHCQNQGGKFIAVGVSPRIMEVFKITRVDSVIRMAATVEEAEALI